MTLIKFNGVETSTEIKELNTFSEHKCHAWISYSFNSLMQKLIITIQYKSFAN